MKPVDQEFTHQPEIGQPVALPAGMPEPDAYMFQHEETGLVQFVDAQQVEWGFEQNNPRLKRIDAVYTAAQVQAMLAQGLAPGWRAVPAEDTPSMWTAGGKAIKNCAGHSRDAASLAYKAMLAAASQPQQIAEPASQPDTDAADMFWNIEDPERPHESIDTFLNDEICQSGVEVGAEFTLLRALSLPKVKIRVTAVDDESCEAEYEVIEANPKEQS